MKQICSSLALAGVLVTSPIAHAQFASSVTAYTEGSGVDAGYNDPLTALGAPSTQTLIRIRFTAAPFRLTRLMRRTSPTR